MKDLLVVNGLTVELPTAAGRQGMMDVTHILMSHSLPVVAQMANRVAVMRAGEFVGDGPVERILRQPTQDYTRNMLAAVAELPKT